MDKEKKLSAEQASTTEQAGTVDLSKYDSDASVLKSVEEKSVSPAIKIAGVCAILMTLFHVYTGLFGLLDSISQRGIHLAFAVTMALLVKPLYEHVFGQKFAHIKAFRIVCRIIDFAMIIGIWAAVFMSRYEYSMLVERLGDTTWMATLAGALLLIIVLETTRRLLGWILPILSMIFLAYAYLGPHLPFAISHVGYSLKRICVYMSTNLDGMFGTCLSVSATVIFMFVVFGAFLEQSGCSAFINDLAISLVGRIKSGPALTAVFASALMGTINGSPVANVVGTGTFTIPLMKKRGYKPAFAGGVEAVASTGGQILPPVMGSGAFLMVAFTAEPYMRIMQYAIIPALLYFLGTAFAVIAQSEKSDIIPTPKEEIPRTRDVFKSGFLYPLIIGVLLWALLIAQLSPLRSALYAVIALPVIMLFDKKKRFTYKSILPSMRKAGLTSISLVLGCACAGIVVSMVSMTGIGVVFGDMMLRQTGGNLFLTLLFSAVTCIILGMGLPTSASYVIGASILAPSLVLLGVPMLTAHMFVFYFACLSSITPPVALAAFAGAGIAGAPPMKTGWEAVKIGFAGFIVPFIFVYNPVLLMQGSVFEILYAFATAIIGIFAMSSGAQGYMMSNLNPFERALLITGGLAMVIPGVWTDLFGIAVVVAVALIKKLRMQKAKA